MIFINNLSDNNITIKVLPLGMEVISPVIHRKLLFKIQKNTLSYPYLKSKTLKVVLDNSLIRDFEVIDSLDEEVIPIKNPCGDDLPHIYGEYFSDNVYLNCSISYFGYLVGDKDVVLAMEEDFFTISSFLYCGCEIVSNPTIYDFQINLSTPCNTLNPISETKEYYIYQLSVDANISLLPIIEINPPNSPLLPQLNLYFAKPEWNNKFTHGELAYINSLYYVNFDINTTSFKELLKYFINLDELIIFSCNYYNPYDEMFNLINLRYLDLANNKISSLSNKIGNLNNLQTLYLYDNNLTYLPPEIGFLNNLQVLYLDCNDLTSIPSEFNKLTNLMYLHLYLNNLYSVPPEIGDLSNLICLYLDYNHISNLSMFYNKEIYISATNQTIKCTLSITSSILNLEFLRDYNDTLPNITNISDNGSLQIIQGEYSIVWSNLVIGQIVTFSFSNNEYFTGSVEVTVI